MDYDYDHLADGLDHVLSTLAPRLRTLEMDYYESDENPTWLTAALDVEDELILFPDGGKPHLQRVQCTVALMRKISTLDEQVFPSHVAQLLVYRLGCELDTQSSAMERHYDITVPFDVRYPPAAQVGTPSP